MINKIDSVPQETLDHVKKRFPDVLIEADKNRFKAAGRLQQKGAELLIMDDGFQYKGLRKDMDILLLDAKNPLGNKKLLPAGILREPCSSLKKADFF